MHRQRMAAVAVVMALAGCSLPGFGAGEELTASEVADTAERLADEDPIVYVTDIVFSDSTVQIQGYPGAPGEYPLRAAKDGQDDLPGKPEVLKQETAVPLSSLNVADMVEDLRSFGDCEEFVGKIIPVGGGQVTLTRECEGEAQQTVWADTMQSVVPPMRTKEEFVNAIQRTLDASGGEPTSMIEVQTGATPSITVIDVGRTLTYSPTDAPVVEEVPKDAGSTEHMVDLGWVWDCAHRSGERPEGFHVHMARAGELDGPAIGYGLDWSDNDFGVPAECDMAPFT